MSATLRSFTDFIFRSRLRAVGLAFALTFVPLVGTLSILIAGLVTLRKGALEGLWVTLAATLPYFCLLPFQPMPLGLWVVAILTASNAFTWGFALLLKRYGTWNLLLELTALIGIICVTTAQVVKPDVEAFWTKQLTTYLGSVDKAVRGTAAAPEAAKTTAEPDETSTEPELINFVNAAKPYETIGAMTASLLFTALTQVFLARWWQLSLVNPKRFREEIYHIHLSPIAGMVFLAAIILSYLKIALALDLLPVLYLTFCIAGLSLVHYALAKLKSLNWLWLFVFYSLLLGSWMVYHLLLAFQLIALIALLDVWFNWREYLDRRFP